MSGAGDCTSQEIEVSTSCSSTRNSKKYTFLQLILNDKKDQTHGDQETQCVAIGERLPSLAYVEKRDFIQNWILAHNNSEDSPTKSSSTTSTANKRLPTSPIHGYQSKRLRQDTNNKEKENYQVSFSRKLQTYENNTPLAVKENNGIYNENEKHFQPEILKCSNNSDAKLSSTKFTDFNRKTTSPTKASRICRRLSWINVDKNPVMHEVETISKGKDSNNLSLHIGLLPDTLSPSSEIVESEGIEAASSPTNGPEDETKIESDSDGTVGYIIETPESQNLDATISKSDTYCVTRSVKIEDSPPIVDERRLEHCQDISDDSDETHYSNGDLTTRLVPRVPLSPKISQIVSQLTTNSRDTKDSTNKSENISDVTSPPTNNSDPTANVTFNTSINNNKKKKKAKKGSLLARVQTLVSSQVSHLRIWRHQLSQPHFKSASTQFVTLSIQTRETRYGRQFFTAMVTDDSHNLLQGLSELQNPLGRHKIGSSFKKQTITLMTVPEITGMIKIQIGGTLRIYPPWEIMDHNRKILNITYFMVITKENSINTFTSDAVKVCTNGRVIEKFECPCITAKKIVNSCRVKFTISKPNVIQQILDS